MTTKRKILMAAIMAAAGMALAGCGKEETEPEAPGVTVEKIPVETAQPQPQESEAPEDSASAERESVDGKMQSYLTGEWKDEAVVNRRPIAVMIPNNTPALPQYGISKASIIYEAPVEGRITRLMGVFEDFDDLERIGPVRSSRDYFLYVAMGYEAIYCNWGLARPYVEELINRDTVQNISAAVEGINNPAHEAFDRVSRSGYATEFTGYLFIDGMLEAAERLGYDWEYDDAYVPPFTFAGDDERAEDLYADGEAVKLTATETKIVELFMRNPGRVFPAEEIYRRVWEEEAFASENTVMVHIRRIREKLELNPKEPEYIKVVWGIGYKMEKQEKGN